MNCLRCGFNNDKFVNFCKKCNAPLPKQGGDASFHDQDEKARLNKYLDAIEKYRSGNLNTGDFLSFLQKDYDKIKPILNEIENISNELGPKSKMLFQQEVDIGTEGLKMFYQGVEMLIELALLPEVPPDEDELFDEIIALLRSGNAKVNEARRINTGRRFQQTI